MEFDLYGDIGGEDEKLSSSAARSFLKANSKADTITVRIKSSGGDVLEGLSIYNMLAGHPGKKIIVVDGLAASIASLICMAGDEVHMIEGSFMMIHNPYAVTKGESADLRKTADVLDKMSASMVNIYAERTGKPCDEILEMMNAETWMSAKEAVKHGFADKVISSKTKTEVKAQYNLGAYAKVPAELLELVSRIPESEAAKNSTQEGATTMGDEDKQEAQPDFAKKFADLEEKVNNLAKFLQDKAKADEDSISSKPDDSEDEESEGSDDEESEDDGDEEEEKEMKDKSDVKTVAKSNKHMAALAEATKLVAQLSAKLEAVEKGKFAARVEDAIKAGQLLPSQKAWALKLDGGDFDAYLEAMGGVRFPIGKEHKEDDKSAQTHAGVESLTVEEKKLARSMGISDEELIDYNKKNPRK